MAAPIINPVAIALFLVSIRFLSSTHFLRIRFCVAGLLQTKAASSDGSGFPYAIVLWHGYCVIVNV
jgi:hypothetical protein